MSKENNELNLPLPEVLRRLANTIEYMDYLKGLPRFKVEGLDAFDALGYVQGTLSERSNATSEPEPEPEGDGWRYELTDAEKKKLPEGTEIRNDPFWAPSSAIGGAVIGSSIYRVPAGKGSDGS